MIKSYNKEGVNFTNPSAQSANAPVERVWYKRCQSVSSTKLHHSLTVNTTRSYAQLCTICSTLCAWKISINRALKCLWSLLEARKASKAWEWIDKVFGLMASYWWYVQSIKWSEGEVYLWEKPPPIGLSIYNWLPRLDRFHSNKADISCLFLSLGKASTMLYLKRKWIFKFKY